MTLSVPLDLAGSYAEADGLEIYEGATQTVKVEIRGPRSLIFKLQENDMRVTAGLQRDPRRGELAGQTGRGEKQRYDGI